MTLAGRFVCSVSCVLLLLVLALTESKKFKKNIPFKCPVNGTVQCESANARDRLVTKDKTIRYENWPDEGTKRLSCEPVATINKAVTTPTKPTYDSTHGVQEIGVLRKNSEPTSLSAHIYHVINLLFVILVLTVLSHVYDMGCY